MGDVWGKFRKELKLFEAFEIHTKMLGWNDKWSFVEHRFVKDGRVVGMVIMRGLFRAKQGNVPPAEFAREMGLPEYSPKLPAWLENWSFNCDLVNSQLRGEEFLCDEGNGHLER
ncbi:hypothetical protein D3C84_1069680 [compost metagenome]